MDNGNKGPPNKERNLSPKNQEERTFLNTNNKQFIVVLKGKHQKKNVSDNPSMDSFTKIYIDSEKV